MHDRGSLISIRVPGRHLLVRESSLAPPSLALLLVVVLLGQPGCVELTGTTGGTVEIVLVSGEVVSGSLFSGQRLRATASVEAGHVYHINANLSEPTVGSTRLGEIMGMVSGDPLAESVAFVVTVKTSPGGGFQVQPGVFVPLVNGEVAIEFVFALMDETGSPGSTLETIRALIQGTPRADYELLITDLGFDDNGTSPDDAVTLAVGLEGELTGTIKPGEEADYFILQVQADTTYKLNLESTDTVNVTSGSEDRFGQINFGVPTAGGLLVTATSSTGTPGTSEFTATATEEVLLRLTGTGSGGGGLNASSAVTIQYAISVVEIAGEGS